jgi:hypothetical protein
MALSTLTATRVLSPVTMTSATTPRMLTSVVSPTQNVARESVPTAEINPAVARQITAPLVNSPIRVTETAPSISRTVASVTPTLVSSSDPTRVVSPISTIQPVRIPISTVPSVPLIEPSRIPVLTSPAIQPRTPIVPIQSSQVVQPRTPIVPIQSVPVIQPVRIPVPIARPVLTTRPVATSVPSVATVIPKTDLFVDPPKRPTLAKRLPAPVRIPTRQAEVEASPGAGQKRVVGQDLAPVRTAKPSAATKPSAVSVEHYKPSIPITSTLASKVAQNPFEDAKVGTSAVPPPQWYIDHYMHEYDRIPASPVSGFGAEEIPSNNWGYFLAAGLLVSAAWFWQKSR